MKKLTSLLIILAVTSLLATTAFADPIHEAAIAGNLADLKRALDASADTNAKDENGATALHHAAGNGHKEVAELLIAKGADMAAKDNRFGSTPLHWAAYRGREKVVEVLIAKGADVNAANSLGRIPVHDAADQGHKKITEILITSGAEVNAKAGNGNTPLDLAVNNEEVTALLRKHGGKLGSIHVAARAGNDEAVKEFLATGTDVNAKNNGGFTPLDAATQGNSTKTVALLRKKGGKSGSEDSILVAVAMGNIDAVKQHLAAGADVELKCKSCGGTALCHTTSKEVVQLLLAKGANVNAKRNNGETPLHYAATKEVAELLIANSANKSAKDDSGETHLHHAAKYGRKEVVELLIAKGADVNAKRNNGQTPLHRAAGGGHKEVAELLIDNGADVNSKIEAGQYTGTPLDWAEGVSRRDSPEVKASKKGIADFLRKHGGKTGEELKAEGK